MLLSINGGFTIWVLTTCGGILDIYGCLPVTDKTGLTVLD